ncbi:hypothetical protein GCK72_007600 [Caenorhabditis remanei]|uniref:Uncharacterized protein n=1 Tax=Caenorhabditis remanei TaxID=31234 RepID=A0A6A5HKI6_CAERE|nr:hypothetical protein GCK72_007600 [Caenorhabditis remanei]KAF1767641.1 hypothetical protein GCK72_007600 [Caenorhabditis remanei]
MNFRLQVFFVLLSIVVSNASDPIEEKRRKDFLSVVNNLRRDIANDLRIPYMHELVYDDSLYQQYDINFKGFASSFKFRSYEELIRYLRVNDGLKRITNDSIIYFRNKTYYEIGLISKIATLLSPLQKQIRCSKLEDGGLKCVLGPIKEPIWWYYSEGEPGSLCDDGYYNYDGLCIMIRVTTTATKVLSTTTARKAYSNEEEGDEECECSGSTRLQTILVTLSVIVYYLF